MFFYFIKTQNCPKIKQIIARCMFLLSHQYHLVTEESNFVHILKQFLGTMYKYCKEDKTLVAISQLTRYTEDIIPLLKVLLNKNVLKLKLDEPVNIKNLKIYYISNPRDYSVSVIRNNMKKVCSWYGSKFNYRKGYEHSKT